VSYELYHIVGQILSISRDHFLIELLQYRVNMWRCQLRNYNALVGLWKASCSILPTKIEMLAYIMELYNGEVEALVKKLYCI
jgi:hypothetical protein